MKAILKTVRFELENLLWNKATLIFSAAYVLIVFAICFSEDLRQSYFSAMESVPVMLNNFVLPIALIFILIAVVSPVFAGDKEQRIEQIPAACLIGSKGRSIAKLIGAILFSLIITLLLEFITLVLCGCFGLIDSCILIKYVGAEIELDPVWAAWRHVGFSAVTLIVGCIMLAILVLLISCCMKNTLSAVGLSCIIVLIEFIINKFSFPTLLQEYNIWVFFRPYYLFITEIINVSPLINLLLYTLGFLPLCLLAVRQIIRKGV